MTAAPPGATWEKKAVADPTASAVAAWTQTTVPTLNSAEFLAPGKVQLRTSLADAALGTTRKAIKVVTRAGGAEAPWEAAGFEVEQPKGLLLLRTSPSGSKLARLVNGEAENTARIEIVGGERLLATLQLPATPLADGWFEGLCWSPDETKLAVVAEPKPKKDNGSRSFFKPADDADSDGGGGGDAKKQKTSAGLEEATPPGGVHALREDWGELHVGHVRPQVSRMLPLFLLSVVAAGPAAACATVPVGWF